MFRITLPGTAYVVGRVVGVLWRKKTLILRTYVVLYFLLPLSPAPPRVVPEPRQTVETSHPILCVHTRLIDEVEDWKVQKTLQLVREMGASTIVEFFPWAYAETNRSTYNWDGFDRIISMAHQEGIQVIARLGLVPGWARPKPLVQESSLNYLTPDHYDDYANFVGAFAARYRGKADLIIAWNEPNLGFEWGSRDVTPAEYVQFLQKVYKAAHGANPDVVLLGGALAPTIEPPGSPNGMNDIEFLRRMYQAGGAPYFDALAVHTYGFTYPPDQAPGPELLNFRRFELLRDVMREFGDGDKPVYVTESSWNDDPRWVNAVRPDQRLRYTLDSLRMVEQDWPTVKKLCFWYFRAPTLTLRYPDYFAFVTPEFRIRPIYSAVQAWARGWDQTP